MSAAADSESGAPQRRVVLLGASNLTRGIGSLIPTARAAWGVPLDVLVAGGHGRSFGATSSVLGRRLPGILQSGLWDDWSRRSNLPTAALVSDIGNDLAYGFGPEQTISWVRQCLDRLAPRVDRLVITLLPLQNLYGMRPGSFLALRTLLFPRSRLTLTQAIESVEQINLQLISFAHQYRAYVIQPMGEWYGWDPIHVRRGHYPRVWQKLFSCWRDGQPPALTPGNLATWWYLRRLQPLTWHRWGLARNRAQPAGRLPDGTRISLY